MECTVNREIRDYREGVVMGLSMRQTIWGGAALVIAGAANFGPAPVCWQRDGKRIVHITGCIARCNWIYELSGFDI